MENIVERKNKRGGSKIANRDFLPKPKPKYTKLDYEKDKFVAVMKTVGNVLKAAPATITGGLVGGVKQLAKAQKEHRTEFPKVGSAKKYNKGMMPKEMGSANKYYNKGGYVITGRK